MNKLLLVVGLVLSANAFASDVELLKIDSVGITGDQASDKWWVTIMYTRHCDQEQIGVLNRVVPTNGSDVITQEVRVVGRNTGVACATRDIIDLSTFPVAPIAGQYKFIPVQPAQF